MREITSPLGGFLSPFGQRQATSPLAIYAVLGFTPPLVLDFKSEKYFTGGSATTFDDALTTSRASSATYVDATGTIQTAAINEARRNHHVWSGTEWVNKGLLVEPTASTNLVTYSEDFTDAAWVKANTATLAVDATGPDGQTSAVTLVDSGATGTGFVGLDETSITVSTSTAYTYSFFAKADQLSGIMLFTAAFTTPGNVGYYFDLSAGTVSDAYNGGTGLTPLIEDYGDGWYRCSITFTTDATDTSGNLQVYAADMSGTPTITVDLDGTSSILIYGAQFEALPYASSYIPTAGATVTRAADTPPTISSANLPWPEPVVIGDELITTTVVENGGWTVSGTTVTAAGTGGSTDNVVFTLSSSLEVGKTYVVEIPNDLPANGFYVDTAGGSAQIGSLDSTDNTVTLVCTSATSSLRVGRWVGTPTGTIGPISVKEINPLAVSIQMEGLMTYAGINLIDEVEFITWESDVNNRIPIVLDTRSPTSGTVRFAQVASGVVDLVVSPNNTYSPGVNVPFNIASRHGSTFINGAVDGTALTANLTPTALPDLSATDLDLAVSGGPMIISKVRIWADDITDAGTGEAST